MKAGIFYIALLAGSIVNFASCKEETPGDLIVNNWKLVEWTLMPEMNVSDSLKTELMKTANMQFTSDKKFIFNGMSANPAMGTYYLSEGGNLLMLMPTNSQDTFRHTVEQLNKERLILIDPMGNKLVCTPQN